MIKYLTLSNVGPAPTMEMEFGQRINLLTGDNGLGKSFLLDIAWWATTRTWPGELNPKLTASGIAYPADRTKEAHIEFSFAAMSRDTKYKSSYQRREQLWKLPQGRPANPGLVCYAMADGSFAVWDPARNYRKEPVVDGQRERPSAYVFSPKEVWDGLQRDDGTWLCNGLIRDWASWQKEKGSSFDHLSQVLAVLSPTPDEPMVPGVLTRINLDDVRDMPTIRMAYGQEVPVVHASAGMRRIIALAYFLVWCREEHRKATGLLGESPDNRIVFLMDEIESHMHPKWQRHIIPALMNVIRTFGSAAGSAAEVQLIAVTHSPLIMASVEPVFDAKQDAWFDLDLVHGKVVLTNRVFTRKGDMRSWLTSEAFDMKSGYSIDAEHLLEEAAIALRDETFGPQAAQELDRKLRATLSDTDPFWMRWRFVAEKKGWLA